MSVSSGPISAPLGWSSDDEYLEKSYYWDSKNPDGFNLPAMLEDAYGLTEVQPTWTRHPDHGEIFFVFEAKPKSGKKLYYLWNGIAGSICQIIPETLDEIRSIIENTGEAAGYLKGLEMRLVAPKDYNVSRL